MSRATTFAQCLVAVAIATVCLSACGVSTTHPSASVPRQPLQAFQLPAVGDRNAADARTWQQYGSRPVDRTLTLNPMTLYNVGSSPLELLSIRQAKPVSGLVIGSEQVTLTNGFSGYSEYVSLGQPASAFGLHANFSPLHGFIVNPNPKAQMAGLSPTVVLTMRATHPGLFHIHDWVVAYRVGNVDHTVQLVDDGEFCAGSKSCPTL